MQSLKKYRISNNVLLQIGDAGEIVATNSMSREPVELSEEMLKVLRSFSRPRTKQAAFDFLPPESINEGDFDQIVGHLAEANVLTTTREAASDKNDYSSAKGHFSLGPVHYNLLRDYVRTMSYRTAIERHVKNKTVIDLGSGSGILAIFAAQSGASKVFAIEESGIADVAAAMFSENGLSDRIQLLRGNSKDVELPEPADVIVHELLCHDVFYENFVPYVEDARRRFLRPENGRLIPYRVDVCCFGLEPDFLPSFAKRVAFGVKEFGPTYGVNIDPLLQHIEASSYILNDWEGWPHQRNDPSREYFYENMLSEEVTLREVDLYGNLQEAVTRNVRAPMTITQDGRLGAVVIFFRARLDEQLSLTSSPFSAKTSWRWKIQDLSKVVTVKAGDQVELVSTIRLFLGKQKLFVDLA